MKTWMLVLGFVLGFLFPSPVLPASQNRCVCLNFKDVCQSKGDDKWGYLVFSQPDQAPSLFKKSRIVCERAMDLDPRCQAAPNSDIPRKAKSDDAPDPSANREFVSVALSWNHDIGEVSNAVFSCGWDSDPKKAQQKAVEWDSGRLLATTQGCFVAVAVPHRARVPNPDVTLGSTGDVYSASGVDIQSAQRRAMELCEKDRAKCVTGLIVCANGFLRTGQSADLSVEQRGCSPR